MQTHTVPGLGGRLLRGLMFLVLSRASRGVLLAREIAMADGSATRWLAADFARYRARLPAIAAELRPYARFDELDRLGNRIMVEFAVWTIAAYRALLDIGVEPAAARTLVADIGWGVYATMLRLASLPARLVTRDPGRRLRWTIRSLLFFPFSPGGAPGCEVETRVDGADILTHFTHCPPQSFVRRLADASDNSGDLQAFRESWCRYDWPGADIIAGDGARGHYRRRRTLSHDDAVCDMCWIACARTAQGR